jgi:hypothetical protein
MGQEMAEWFRQAGSINYVSLLMKALDVVVVGLWVCCALPRRKRWQSAGKGGHHINPMAFYK